MNGEASSPPPAINDNRPASDNLDTVLFQLRQVTRERDELRKRLALASPGTTFDDCRYGPPLPPARLTLLPFVHLVTDYLWLLPFLFASIKSGLFSLSRFLLRWRC